MRISDWSSDVCSSDLGRGNAHHDQRIDPLCRQARHQIGIEEHAGAMRQHDGFVGLPVQLRRHLVIDKKPQLLDALAVLVARADFRVAGAEVDLDDIDARSEEHTSELQYLMRISYDA